MVDIAPKGWHSPEPTKEVKEALKVRKEALIKELCEESGEPYPPRSLEEDPSTYTVQPVIPVTPQDESFFQWKLKNAPEVIDDLTLDEIIQLPGGIDSLYRP